MKPSPAGTRLSLLLLAAVAASGCDLLLSSPDEVGKNRESCSYKFSSFTGQKDANLECWMDAIGKGCTGRELDVFIDANLVETYGCKLLNCEPKGCASFQLTDVAPGAEVAPAVETTRVALAAAVPANERAALIALYNATNGQNWFSSDRLNWLGAPGTECTWAGVFCDPAGEHVTAIRFETVFLDGQLPAEIGGLTELQELVIDGATNLTGPLPAAIGNLEKLLFLSLRQTKLSGPLPSALGGLSALEVLSIASTDFSGPLPSALGNLAELRGLRISATRVSGSIPAALGNLTKLRALDLRFNELDGSIPASLGNLTGLEGLNLGWNDLSGPLPSTLGSLAKLEHLNLERNRLSGAIPTAFGNLASLETLTLDANQLTGPLPDSLSSLAKLRNLSVGFNGLTGALPAALPNLAPALEILYLPNNELSGPLSDLSALGKLTDLQLSWNDFDPGPMPAWLAAPPLAKLERLDLSRTGRTGAFPDLSGLPLTHLAIGENAFDSGPIPEWIGAETTLVHLDLRGTGRTGDIPSFLAQLDSLKALILSDNPFNPGPIPGFLNRTEMGVLSNVTLDNTQRTGGIPIALFDLSLSTLRLARNQLTGTIPKEVKKPLIKVLDLSQNQLGGALPQELGTQVRMQSLRLNGNKFSGVIPAFYKSSLVDEDMIEGAIHDDFGREFPGLDLRFNALTTSDPEMVALFKQKHKGGVDFQATQTVAPAGLKATATGKNSIKLTWTPIAFSAGPGGYTVEMGTKAKGPFSVLGTSANKTVSTATITGLKANTQYFFRLKTTSGASADNPNVLVSLPTKAAKAKTKK